MSKLIINDFEKLPQEYQEELQDIISGITPNWIIEE